MQRASGFCPVLLIRAFGQAFGCLQLADARHRHGLTSAHLRAHSGTLAKFQVEDAEPLSQTVPDESGRHRRSQVRRERIRTFLAGVNAPCMSALAVGASELAMPRQWTCT